MACGLFAQIGLIAHLYSLMVPALGPQLAGLAMGLATASAIAGRTLVGWLMPADADRRLVACASYTVQIAGSVVFILAAGTSVPLLLLGVVLFGSGIGNATSLPPLIAQAEFLKDDVPRVVALTVAIAQGTYAFAPSRLWPGQRVRGKCPGYGWRRGAGCLHRRRLRPSPRNLRIPDRPKPIVQTPRVLGKCRRRSSELRQLTKRRRKRRVARGVTISLCAVAIADRLALMELPDCTAVEDPALFRRTPLHLLPRQASDYWREGIQVRLLYGVVRDPPALAPHQNLFNHLLDGTNKHVGTL